MTIDIKHHTQAIGTYPDDGELGTAEWNEGHDIALASGTLLGNSTESPAAEEITVGANLSLESGALSATASGDTGQVQFNDGGAFAASQWFTYTESGYLSLPEVKMLDPYTDANMSLSSHFFILDNPTDSGEGQFHTSTVSAAGFYNYESVEEKSSALTAEVIRIAMSPSPTRTDIEPSYIRLQAPDDEYRGDYETKIYSSRAQFTYRDLQYAMQSFEGNITADGADFTSTTDDGESYSTYYSFAGIRFASQEGVTNNWLNIWLRTPMPPSGVSGGYELTLPNVAPVDGQFMVSNGSGILSWGERAAASPPSTASSTGRAGEVRYDSGYVYVCVATNTWKRAALSTW